MPTYEVTDPETGRKLRLTGDSPPTEAELEQIFSQQFEAKEEKQKGASFNLNDAKSQFESLLQSATERGDQAGIALAEKGLSKIDEIAGLAEPSAMRIAGQLMPFSGNPESALAIGSSFVAEPIAGLAGIAGAVLPGEEGQGARFTEATRQALTYQPRTEFGQGGVEVVGGILQPVGAGIEAVGEGIGEAQAGVVRGLGGSEEAQAAAFASGKATPDALLSLIPGARASKVKPAAPAPKPAQQAITQAITEAESAGPVGRGKARQQAAQTVAEQADIDPALVAEARQLGLSPESIPPEVLAKNQAFRETAGEARSIPSSEASSRYRQFNEQFGQTVDDVLTDIDSVDVTNQRVGEALTSAVDEARSVESGLYDSVDELVGNRASSPVDTSTITNELLDVYNGAGRQFDKMTKLEQHLFKRFLQPDGKGGFKPRTETWQAITSLRKEMNAKGGDGSTFQNAAEYEIGQYSRLISETQKLAADSLGVGDEFRLALESTGRKKSAQEAQMAVMGKNLDKSLSALLEPKVKGLAKGRIDEFEVAIKDIPEDLRRSAIESMVADKVMSKRRADPTVDIAGFNSWFTALGQNPKAKAALYENLSPDVRRNLESIGKLTQGIKRANEDKIKTGNVLAGDEFMNKARGIITPVIRAAVAAKTGILGGEVAGAAARPSGSKRMAQAADELMADPAFHKAIADEINSPSSGRSTPVNKLPTWRKFLGTLDKANKQKAIQLGAIGYLQSFENEEEE